MEQVFTQQSFILISLGNARKAFIAWIYAVS